MIVKIRRGEVPTSEHGPVVGVKVVHGVVLKVEVGGTGREIGDEGKRGSTNEVWP